MEFLMTSAFGPSVLTIVSLHRQIFIDVEVPNSTDKLHCNGSI